VKKLDQCAVTLLMGCSSGKLQDAGEFDPWGMPKNYLIGGCPALVSTLWDVTDRDLDRFSKNLLKEWGLFGEETSDAHSRSRSKSKVKKKESSRSRPATPIVKEKRGKVSLVEAVACSRDQCKMRYLNGAALVVYGVPAYL
jgi:separase